jgi:DNA-binding transcriptional ArsR family regulator
MDRSAAADRSLTLPVPDYEADDVLVIREPERLRALADEVRMKIIALLRDRAASTTELAEQLGMPKGTVGHHVKVLEQAGLLRVVRTRQVRALTERYYGRTARLFVMKGEGEDSWGGSGAILLRQAADEVTPAAENSERATFALLHRRLSEKDAQRFLRRLERLIDDFHETGSEGDEFALVVGLYPSGGGGA